MSSAAIFVWCFALSVNNDITTEDRTITELFCKYQVLRMIRKGLEKISCKLQNN